MNILDKLKSKSHWLLVIVVLIFIYIVIFRFIIFSSEKAVHYHANFQIYIHGKLVEFSSHSYFEEVSACSLEAVNKPSSRAHMHDQVSHLIHVHDYAVTYNHFFNNLGLNVSNDILQIHHQYYINKNDGNLTFILNGQRILSMTNRYINNEDILLIDFGTDDLETIMDRYNKIPRDAAEANWQQDPQSCLGSGQSTSFWSRFKKALGF